MCVSSLFSDQISCSLRHLEKPMARRASLSSLCPPGKKASGSGSQASGEGGSGRGQGGAAAAAGPEVICSCFRCQPRARVRAQVPAKSVGAWRERCSVTTLPPLKSRGARPLRPPQIEPQGCPVQSCHPPGGTLPSVQELS